MTVFSKEKLIVELHTHHVDIINTVNDYCNWKQLFLKEY